MLEENGGRCDEATKPRALRGRLGREGGVRVGREKKGDEPGVRTDGLADGTGCRIGRVDLLISIWNSYLCWIDWNEIEGREGDVRREPTVVRSLPVRPSPSGFLTVADQSNTRVSCVYIYIS